MRHFVAYHSERVMKRRLEIGRDKRIDFVTRKTGAQLTKTRGQTLWIISGDSTSAKLTYRLHGTYVAEKLVPRPEHEDTLVRGPISWRPPAPIPLDGLAWFPALLRTQNNFSLGLNEIADPEVLTGLLSLAAPDPFVSLFPEPAAAAAAAAVLADAIALAHAHGPAAWVVTQPEPNVIRLSVGPMEVLVLNPGVVRVLHAAPAHRARGLRATTMPPARYRSLAPLAVHELVGPPRVLHRAWPEIRRSFDALAAAASKRRTETTWKDALNPTLIDHLRGVTGQPVPLPAYAPGSDVSPRGNLTPERITRPSPSYVRDERVRAEALRRARGTCQACDEAAPFARADGTPYLESHHLVHLAERGHDTLENIAALCPNCHRALHYAADREDRRASLLARRSPRE